MEEKRSTARRAGLTAERIAETACALTRERGINGWSMRDLAGRLDVAPSVVYHYYRNRAQLTDAAVERIVLSIGLPDDALPWKEWFVQAAEAARAVLLEHNGVADILLTGNFPLAAMPAFDRAFGKLCDAGFGRNAPFAYAMIFNVAVGAIAGRDHQSDRERVMPHDMDGMLARMRPWTEASPHFAAMLDEFLTPLTEGRAAGPDNATSERYFGMLMRALLHGMEETMTEAPYRP